MPQCTSFLFKMLQCRTRKDLKNLYAIVYANSCTIKFGNKLTINSKMTFWHKFRHLIHTNFVIQRYKGIFEK